MMERMPLWDIDYEAVQVESTMYLRRSVEVAGLARDFAFHATGSRDPATRSRAARIVADLARLDDWLREQNRQVCARSWRH